MHIEESAEEPTADDTNEDTLNDKSADRYHRLSAIDLRKLEAKLEMAGGGTGGEAGGGEGELTSKFSSFNSKSILYTYLLLFKLYKIDFK